MDTNSAYLPAGCGDERTQYTQRAPRSASGAQEALKECWLLLLLKPLLEAKRGKWKDDPSPDPPDDGL